MLSVLVFVMIVGGSLSAGAQSGATVTLKTTPDPLGLGQNRFDVTVKDAKGQPIANADVFLSLVMPSDPKTKHPEMRTEGKLNNVGGGRYNGIAMVTMAGAWNVTATASRHGKPIGHAKASLTAYATRPPAGAGRARPAAGAHRDPQP